MGSCRPIWVGLFFLACGLLLSLALNLTLGSRQSPSPPVAIEVASAQRPNALSPLGTGLSGVAYWSSELPFLDHFKTASSWITQCVSPDPDCRDSWNTHEEALLNRDPQGWVRSLPKPEDTPRFTRVSALMLVGLKNRYPSGQYVVRYQGEGKLEYGFDARYNATQSRPGRDVIDVDASQGEGILLTIVATDPQRTGNYLRQIQVVYQPDEARLLAGELFNPRFLAKIRPFRSLRFMDWQGTNNSNQQLWSDRPRLDDVTYTQGKGVPLEVMMALVNQLQADPWFNLPHQATDDYMQRFAKQVKDSIAPHLTVYVEFSNEVWNAGFAQQRYAQQQGKIRWGQDREDAYMNWYGMRTSQMCDIWKQVFGSRSSQIACVISTQTAWKGLENAALDCPYWVREGHSPCDRHADVYSIAGYFGGELGDPQYLSQITSWWADGDGGLGRALRHLRQGDQLGGTRPLGVPATLALFRYHAAVAQKRGLRLVAYEGGQHIVGHSGTENNDRLTQFLITLNRRSEMAELYKQLLEGWQQAGGTLFVHYLAIAPVSKWGSWGALEYVDQQDSPKYNALMTFNRNHPCWWPNCGL